MKSINSLTSLCSKPLLLRSTPITVLVVAILYTLLVKISFLITIDPGTVSPIFLSAGFALASVLILGHKALLGIFFGSLYSNIFLNINIANLDKTQFLTHIPISFFISIGIVIATITATIIVTRLCKKEHPLNNGKNVLTLLILGPISYSTITSLIGVTSLTLYGSIPIEQFWYTYKTWWLGDAIGIILITPLMLSWFPKDTFNKNDLNFLELTLYGLATIILCLGVFFQYNDLKYLILPLLFWSAYRFGIQITTLFIIIIALFAIITTVQGIGPFNKENINESILFLDLFLSAITICSLFLAGIISERQKAEDALKKSEEKYRNIFENIQDVIFQTDPNGVFWNISPSIKDISDYIPEELIGKPTNILQPDDEPKDAVINLVKEQLILNNYEKLIKTKSGVLKHISLSAKMIFDKNGVPHHIDAIAQDITQRKKNEREIAFQNQKLQIQNKELEQFAYITSHDLQEPLLTLKCFTELIKEEFPDSANENIKQYLDFIFESSNRMQKLVKGLLDYSRIGKQIEIKEVDSNEIVNDAISSLSDIIQKTETQITIGYLPKVQGYSVELIQLFQNLIENAIKFKKKEIPLTINISAKLVDKNWLFNVEDNGIGIDNQNKEKVFIIFKRLNDREEYSGTGIGLALCKKIIALHGGDIWIESSFGQGTIVYFTIPT